MEHFEITDRNKVKRAPKRGAYDRKTVYEILDEGKVCHVAFNYEGRPVNIPTAYGRFENQLFLHGAQTSRMLTSLEKGIDVSICVTLLDGLVLARSVFHHSMNYRSVVIFGKARLVSDPEELNLALRAITEHLVPNRWQEARLPNDKEIKATKILSVTIEEASAKIRTGPPVDDKEDYALPIWAGVLPLAKGYGQIIPDEELDSSIEIPQSVHQLKNLNKE